MDNPSHLAVNRPNSVSAYGIGDSLKRWLSRAIGANIADGIFEFLVFGIKQAAACVFAGSFLFLLAISSHVHIPGLARYDFLFLSAITIQVVLIAV